ncbi:MAG: HAMP domain-containing histidine kinase [Alphaproteobacteria bacterium]|nr:HAMP domain-containing histidine kinase [Alphaproteobacteria bacterium]
MTDTPLTQPPLVSSLSARLLLLTIAFVMLAEVLIFVPSISRFRAVYLEQRLAAAELASLALEATPDRLVSEELAMELLSHAQAKAVIIKGPTTRRLVLADDMPRNVDAMYYLSDAMPHDLIRDAFDALHPRPDRTIHVVGRSRQNPELVIEVVLDEAPLVSAMYDYSWRIMSLSVVISLITAGLVYVALQWLMVRPMTRITRSMVEFHEHPEDVSSTIVPSTRKDEIGLAQRELVLMQVGLRASLQQKDRLATLGTAVSKISHDLRNILATAQLISDRIVNSTDPEVRRVTPTLVRAIDRAVDLCSNTLSFVGHADGKIHRHEFDLRDLVEDVGLSLGLSEESKVKWFNEIDSPFVLSADREQVFRALLNIGRNAVGAIQSEDSGAEGLVKVTAHRENGMVSVDVTDDGPGLADELRGSLFKAFAKSEREGSTGLGLVIARDIARAHGGEVRLMGSGPGGTRFRVELAEA